MIITIYLSASGNIRNIHGVPVRMSRRSYIDDLEVPEMPVIPEIPKDTVEVLTKYLLTVKKADTPQPAREQVKEPTVVAKEEIEEAPKTHNSIPVS